MKDSDRLWLGLLESDVGKDRENAMLILSDALEEENDVDLANALRWAAHNGKWPFQRFSRPNKFHPNHVGNDWEEGQKVWDWDSEMREVARKKVPTHAHIPAVFVDFIFLQEDRVYGGVREAFVILARAMKAYDESISPREGE